MVESFGLTKGGAEARLYTLKNSNNINVALTDFGATLVGILVPDREERIIEVTLGYDDVTGYEQGGLFLGAVVGRVANRIGSEATFSLNGVKYQLHKNDNGKNNLHSGTDFFSQRMWEVLHASEEQVVFGLHSPAGDQGYPGAADIRVAYELTEDNELQITYSAVPTEDTLFNMTNHSYFNLNGDSSGDILGHRARIDADAFTVTDEDLIPTGEIAAVSGTPMDFRQEKVIGQDINADFEPLKIAGGYDHNWVLSGSGYRRIASLYSEQTGIRMDVSTDLPGVQMYTGNFIEDTAGRRGCTYKKRQGVCFETQYFPDAVNHENFASPVTKAHEEYRTTTGFKFTID